MRTIRCSSLPALFKCGHSQDDSDLLIEAYVGAADLGTATHDAMTSVVAGLSVDLDLLALRWGVDRDELGPLVFRGRKVWDELRAAFPRPETEVDVAAWEEGWPFKLEGHIDLLSIIDRYGRFIDWKTGRKEETDYYAQIAGYATALIYGHGLDEVTGTVAWLRSETAETYRFTRRDASDFLGRIEAQLRPTARYSHGEHCGFCPRSHNCQALVEIGRRDAAIFREMAEHGELTLASKLMSLGDPEVVSLRRRAKTLATFAESMDAGVRRVVAARGPLDSGDDYALSLVEENGKREIDTEKAWPILQQRLDDAELASCITVHASKVDSAIAKKAGHGNGTSAKRRIAAEFEEVGAVSQGTVMKLKEVRQPRFLNSAQAGKDSQ